MGRNDFVLEHRFRTLAASDIDDLPIAVTTGSLGAQPIRQRPMPHHGGDKLSLHRDYCGLWSCEQWPYFTHYIQMG